MNIFTKISSAIVSGSNTLTNLITRTVVEQRVKSEIAQLKKYYYTQRDTVNGMGEQVESSTGYVGEIIDSAFGLWAKGMNGATNTALLTVCENEEAIVNLISNNAPALVKIGQGLKSLNTDINKKSALSLFTALQDDFKDYRDGEFKDLKEDVMSTEIMPATKATGEVWGMEDKWYLMDLNLDADEPETTLIRVTEEEYDTFKKAYKKEFKKWDEVSSMFTTKQTSCIHPREEQTTQEFYEALGINYDMIKERN